MLRIWADKTFIKLKMYALIVRTPEELIVRICVIRTTPTGDRRDTALRLDGAQPALRSKYRKAVIHPLQDLDLHVNTDSSRWPVIKSRMRLISV